MYRHHRKSVSLLVVLTVALFFADVHASPSIAFDSTASFTLSSCGAPFTSPQSYTQTITSAPNTIIVIGFGEFLAGTGVSSVTIGGVSATFLRRDSEPHNIFTEIWYLANPPSGLQTITSTLGTSAVSGVGSVTYAGVNVASPVDFQAGNSATSTTPSVTFTSTWPDMVFTVIATNTCNSQMTVTSGQTVRWSYGTLGVNPPEFMGNDILEPVGTFTLSETLLNTNWAVSSIGLISLNQPPPPQPNGSAGPAPVFLNPLYLYGTVGAVFALAALTLILGSGRRRV
jgi:hypothetical protein